MMYRNAGWTFEAGSLEGELLPDGRVKNLRIDGAIVVAGIYFAAREEDWNTPSVSTTAQVNARDAVFESTCFAGDALLSWSVRFEVSADRLELRAKVTSDRDVRLQRAGFVMLHPGSLEGSTVEVDHVERQWTGRIMPTPLFSGFSDMLVMTEAGKARVLFDLAYETEDHRNWSDPGWKTYTPPLASGAFTLAAGVPIISSVTIVSENQSTRTVCIAPLGVSAGEEFVEFLEPYDLPNFVPAFGTTVTDPAAVSVRAIASLAETALSVLRMRVDHWTSRAQVRELDMVANKLHATILLDLVIESSVSDAVSEVIRSLRSPYRVAVSSAETLAVTPATFDAARRALGVETQLGGGSTRYYAELNRTELPGDVEFITFPVVSTVHHSADDLVLDTTRVVSRQARDAHERMPGVPVIIGPVSLQDMPAHSDRSAPYQKWDSNFSEVWSIGMLESLTTGADEFSFIEAVGDQGLVREDGAWTQAGSIVAHVLPRSVVRLLPTSHGTGISVVASMGPDGIRGALANRTVREMAINCAFGTKKPLVLTLPPFGVALISAKDGELVSGLSHSDAS